MVGRGPAPEELQLASSSEGVSKDRSSSKGMSGRLMR